MIISTSALLRTNLTDGHVYGHSLSTSMKIDAKCVVRYMYVLAKSPSHDNDMGKLKKSSR